MNRIELPKLKRSGSAIILVLFAVVVLSLMGVGLLRLGLSNRILAIRNASGVVARCSADAGLTRALFEMNEKLEVEPWNDSYLPLAANETLSSCDATFSYIVTGDISSGYTIQSTGNSSEAEKNVSCTLRLKGPFEFAIFSDDGIEMKYGGVVDWYNYDDEDETFQVGTNSIIADSIDLKSNTTINGDVVVGVGGNPDSVVKDNGATITGETYALTEENPLPEVTVPQWLQLLPSGGTIENDKTISNNGRYDEIDLGNGEIITIDEPVTLYIVGDITLGNSAQIQIDNTTNPDASLTLYVGDDFEGKNGSDINNGTENPKKLKMYGLDSCHNIRFKNSSDFYGVIYALNASVQFDNSADAYGAVVAKDFEQKNSAVFNYDASLRDVSISDEVVRFVVKRWDEQ